MGSAAHKSSLALLCLGAFVAAQSPQTLSQEERSLLKVIERRLFDNDREQRRKDLDALIKLGAKAGVAVPALYDLLKSKIKSVDFDHTVKALAELAPYRTDNAQIEWADLTLSYAKAAHRGRRQPDKPTDMFAHERLRVRFQFPRNATIEELIAATHSRHAYRIETALDLLALRGPAAASAVPALLAQLSRPEPRLLTTDRKVPIYRKVANTIAVIAKGSDAATFAEQVASGEVAAPIKSKPIPARAKARADALAAELANPSKRANATANLLALGELSALPVASLLTADRQESLLTAAIEVLIQLGPRAHKAAPAIVEALTKLPAPHTAGLVEALAHIAPWSRDLVPLPDYSMTFGHLEIRNTPIKGLITGEFLNEVAAATQLFRATRSIDPTDTLAAFANHLSSKSVSERECALAMLRERGESARTLLPTLAKMLTAEHPKLFVSEWKDARTVSVKPLDRSTEVHKAAAKTILAIARPDDPERKLAQAFLKQN